MLTMAALCLGRLMLLDKDFAQAHIVLILRLCLKESNESLQACCLSCVGDFYKRWPQLIEPLTKSFVKVLDDEKISVKVTAITVISHLVLSKNLKDTRAISSIAFLINDESKNEHIRSSVDSFMTEMISMSGNEEELLQKVIPDVILRLSEKMRESSLKSEDDILKDKEKFKKIVEYLITKASEQQDLTGKKNSSKMYDELIIKMCTRFKSTDDGSIHELLA